MKHGPDPATPGAHSPVSLGEHLVSPSTRHAMVVQSEVLSAVRECLANEGFQELLPPLTGPVSPSSAEAFSMGDSEVGRAGST